MLQKDYEIALEKAWKALQPGECFFVPCLDELEAKKIGLLKGYYSQKNAPAAKVGIYRGVWGVLFFREPTNRRTNPLKKPKRHYISEL
jgi:hypothetical protein